MCPCDDTRCLKQKHEVTFQQNSSRLIFHSRPESRDVKRQRKSEKGTLSFKLSVELSAQDALRSEKKFCRQTRQSV